MFNNHIKAQLMLAKYRKEVIDKLLTDAKKAVNDQNPVLADVLIKVAEAMNTPDIE